MKSTLLAKNNMSREKRKGPKRKLNRITEILEERERNVAWLAKKSGLSNTMVHLVCRHESYPTLINLYKLAKALEMDMCELLDKGDVIKG